MNYSISIFGVPYSGKSTLLSPYQSSVFYMGDYLRKLIKKPNVDEDIKYNVSRGLPLTKKLFQKIFSEIPFTEDRKIIFDGSPRNLDQVEVMKARFNLKIGIEVLIDEEIWIERILKAQKTRPNRTDNSIERLKRRKEIHQKDIIPIRKHFDEWYSVDNSGNINEAQNTFNPLIKKLL